MSHTASTHRPPGREQTPLEERSPWDVRPEDGEVVVLPGTVVSLLPQFEQVHVRTLDGEIYGITPQTPGVPMAQLREGEQLLCHITERWPRVVLTERAK